MSNLQYFLITSYLGGDNNQSKKNHLIRYVGKIREYFPYSYIILIDSVNDSDISKICDLYICENHNVNIPHGQADLVKVKIGISILKGMGVRSFIRSAYDYWINDIIYDKYREWYEKLSFGYKVVLPKWKAEIDSIPYLNNSVSMGFGCYTIEGAEKLFGFNRFENSGIIVEGQLYNTLTSKFDKNEYFIYDSNEEMFGCMAFDIFNNSGKDIDIEREKLTT